MRTSIAVAVLLLLSARPPVTAAPSAAGAEYWVSPTGSNSNAGTQAKPFLTIGKAASVVTAGSTVHVASGVYTAAVVTSTSGTSVDRIRYVSDTRWGARIVTTGADIAWTNRGNYVDIEGFDISGDSRIGIHNPASHVRILRNRVHDNQRGSYGGSGGGGIVSGNYPSTGTSASTSGNQVIGNVLLNMGKPGESSSTQGHGIYVVDIGPVVSNNIIGNNSGIGITTWHAATRVTISNNLLWSNRGGGIVIGNGDAPGQGSILCDDSIVSNNIVINNNGPGINEFGANGLNNVFTNNCLYGNTSGPTRLQHGHVARNTVTSDARFVNFKLDGSGDYHLRSDSPCVDAGTSQGAPATDFDGRTRPQNGVVDIGPYEFAAAAPPPPPAGDGTLFGPAVPVASPVATSPAPVELGVKFRSDVAGYVSGIRFYKASGNSGPHVGNLWSGSGALLATAVFSGETGSGWQQVDFAAPVAISAGTLYVASYFAPAGGWSFELNYFATAGVDSPPLHAPANGVDGPNGVFSYGSASTFPTSSYLASNYWVDIDFSTTAPPLPPPAAGGSDPSGSSDSSGSGKCGALGMELLLPLALLRGLRRRRVARDR